MVPPADDEELTPKASRTAGAGPATPDLTFTVPPLPDDAVTPRIRAAALVPATRHTDTTVFNWDDTPHRSATPPPPPALSGTPSMATASTQTDPGRVVVVVPSDLPNETPSADPAGDGSRRPKLVPADTPSGAKRGRASVASAAGRRPVTRSQSASEPASPTTTAGAAAVSLAPGQKRKAAGAPAAGSKASKRSRASTAPAASTAGDDAPPGTAKARLKFDLQASLRRPLKYTPYTGPIAAAAAAVPSCGVSVEWE
ncbi:hypothetical protein H9P43_001310 [Blastocladiella emersonii ATCC 22665]|nr:hypothetical protein H9P43_001310 [Blastocladiella emersonii ATCC 22665]